MSQEEVPKTCKAAVCKDRGENYTIELRDDFPTPKPEKGEVLIRLTATGLCLSDHHFMKGDWGIPMMPGTDCAGHEGAGRVVALGEGVDPAVWKIGDRAGLKPLYDCCGACEHCRNGNETICDSGPFTGCHVNGSYLQYVRSPAKYTTRIPEGVPDEIAAPIMCSGGTAYTALKVSGAKPGQWVVIPGGGGGVGSMAVQYAAKALALRVLVVDTGDDKEALVKKLGAEAFLDFRKSTDLHADAAKITQGGAHAVVCTGGSKSAYANAHFYLRKAGVMVCVGLPPAGEAFAGGDPGPICFRKIVIRGSLVSGMDDVDEALSFAARGLVKPAVTVYPWKQLPEVVKKLAVSNVVGRAVVKFDE